MTDSGSPASAPFPDDSGKRVVEDADEGEVQQALYVLGLPSRFRLGQLLDLLAVEEEERDELARHQRVEGGDGVLGGCDDAVNLEL